MSNVSPLIKSSGLVKSRLDGLPNETLENIMHLSVGVTALHALVEANFQAKALFERCPHAMLLSAIRCSIMEVELQKMLCTIISIRQARKSHASDEALQACINKLLQDRSTTIGLEVSSPASSKPLETLREAADICNDITQAEMSFVKVRLPKTPARIQSSISSDRFYRTMRHPFTLSFKARRQSPTELHRIRRALWRLRLYFEACYEPYLPSSFRKQERAGAADHPAVQARIKPAETLGVWGLSHAAKLDYIRYQGVFFSNLTVWELEEMECVWYHLFHQTTNIWRRPCPFCRQQLLPDDLVGHLRECEQHVVSGNVRFHYDCNFQKACSWYRGDLESNYLGVTTANNVAAWPGTLARKPSAGFQFFMDRYEEIDPYGDPIGVGWLSRHYLSEFLEWGYCIWDRERLEAWCLVDSEDGNSKAVLDWWTTDSWKRLRDRHHRDERSRRSWAIANSTHRNTRWRY